MRHRLIGALLAITLAGAAHAAPGRLVIAGGGVARDNASVHGAFLARLGPSDRIAVIPAASGEPALSAQAYVDTLAAYGVRADRIDIVRLALIDDDATPDTDESRWASNATNPEEIAKIDAAAGVWFTGGDQLRVTAALLTTDGGDTPMLSALRARLAAGATLGGTSAGAAIMSATMIGRGDSLSALTTPVLKGDEPTSELDGGALLLAAGLGFFRSGLVDQHFSQRARLGRLTRAVSERASTHRVGFGIDEDTALVVDLADNAAVVAGAGGITVVDARGAKASVTRRDRFSARDVVVSVLAPGDRIDLATLAITPAQGRAPAPPASGQSGRTASSGAGMALPFERLEDVLGAQLFANRGGERVERVSFDGRGVGVRYVFEGAPNSWAASGDDAAGDGRYTISGVRFSIEPVELRVRPHRR